MSQFKVGEYEITSKSPVFIVAEMSANHGGSLEKAKRIIESAKRAGANAVKLQTYRADTITLKSSKDDFALPKDSPWYGRKTLYDLYEEAHTPWEWHEELFQHARKCDIEIFSAPFDETAVDFLESLGCPLYKIASPEINHIPLLKKVACTGKPVILSSGVADLAAIELAIRTLFENGCTSIALLKCTTAYPAPLEEANLITIKDYAERFGCLVGLSDHTLGSLGGVVATTIGAKIIEKHFIDDRSIDTADSFFSMTETEFKDFVLDIRKTEKLIGEVTYELTKSAVANRRGMRSLYVSENIKNGDVLTELNIKCVRPSFGLEPMYYSEVLGKKVLRDLEAGERLSKSDIEGFNEL